MSVVLLDKSFDEARSFKLNDNVNIGISLTKDRQLEVSIAGMECVTKFRFKKVTNISAGQLMDLLKKHLENNWKFQTQHACLAPFWERGISRDATAEISQQNESIVIITCRSALEDTKEDQVLETNFSMIGNGVSRLIPRGYRGSVGFRAAGFCNSALSTGDSIVKAFEG
jgi:hypothetical protein